MGFQGRPQGHSQRASHKNIYDIASTILTKLDREQGTIKSLVLADNIPEKKKTYALVCESLKYRDALNELIAASDLLNLEKKNRITPNLAQVLVYDLLFGRGVRSGGHYLRIIMNHKVRLSGELTKLKIKRGVKTNRELIPEAIRKAVVLPRYVRVNTLKNSSEQVIKQFESEGYRAVPIVNLADVRPRTIQVDKHVPNLLVFPANTDFHEHPLLLNGGIVLQDKASCFPAYILNPPPNSTVIDACAAPGNKTSHLSAIMNNTGRIYAFDKDQKRLQTLIKLCGRAGCKNIDALNQSFLDADPTSDKYKKVEYILLDPSCSGSGIVRRLDHLLAPKSDGQDGGEVENDDGATAGSSSSSGDAARVQSLADFQVSVLLHAFKFPNVRKVVYSTCSRHQEENEMVVKRVLEAQPDFVLAANVFPQWHRRGDPIVDGHGELVRTDPDADRVIGFFVALFERKSLVTEQDSKTAATRTPRMPRPPTLPNDDDEDDKDDEDGDEDGEDGGGESDGGDGSEDADPAEDQARLDKKRRRNREKKKRQKLKRRKVAD